MELPTLDIQPQIADANFLVEDEHQMHAGSYVAIIRFRDDQYEFLVRDMRREGPTIYGSKVDLDAATAAVKQLLQALVAKM